MHNQNGKTLTIFVILVTILLISSTAIGFFIYQKESQTRKALESQLQESIVQKKKLVDELDDAKNEIVFLQDKNKEVDKKINNLMDEIELNSGLHAALKKENGTLKESLDVVNKEKDSIRAELDSASKRLLENQEMLKAEQQKTRDLLVKVKEFEEIKPQELVDMSEVLSVPIEREVRTSSKNKLELDKIVVLNEVENKPRVLSVDQESEFIICSIGINQGVKSGDILSVYRGDRYLGEVKVSRSQEQMSAADFVPPLSSRKVRKNDIVVLKQS